MLEPRHNILSNVLADIRKYVVSWLKHSRLVISRYPDQHDYTLGPEPAVEFFFHTCSGPRYSNTLVSVQDVPNPNPNPLTLTPNPNHNPNPNPNMNSNPNPDPHSWTGTCVEKNFRDREDQRSKNSDFHHFAQVMAESHTFVQRIHRAQGSSQSSNNFSFGSGKRVNNTAKESKRLRDYQVLFIHRD